MKRQVLAPEIAAEQDAPVPLEVWERRRAAPITDEDVAETMELVRWFRRRYPTVRERFRYISRKYAEWTRYPPARVRR